MTQLTVSLLGLIVFPWEQTFDENVKALNLGILTKQGWPEWSLHIGSCAALGELVHHLRNAVAHRRLRFSSDSPELKDVMIQFSDSKGKMAEPHWSAEISAEDLHVFCLKFIALVEDTIG